MSLSNKLLILVLVFIISACATVVAPNGGLKDTSPPIPLSYDPLNGSMNMQEKEVVIKFDEFVVLKELLQQMIVSPQMPETPDVSIRGKKLIIKIPDSLRENTTYTIFFGDAVVNYKENLPVHNFEYHFSTGNVVDSLQLHGKVVSAFNHTIYEELYVMLYKKIGDSVLYKQKPYYLTKAESNGSFHLHNLAPGEYQIYALKDINRNYIFDQEIEEIAFYETTVNPYYPAMAVQVKTDSIINDSIEPQAPQTPEDIKLFVYSERPKKIRFLTKKIFRPNKVVFTFNRGINDFRIIPQDFSSDSIWHFDTYSRNRDTVTTFLLGLKNDTINVIIAEGEQHIDTLELVLIKAKKKKQEETSGFFGIKKAQKDTMPPKPKPIPKISYQNNISNSFHFFSEIEFKFKVPLNSYYLERIELYKARDTLWIPVRYEAWLSDTANRQRIRIKSKLEERAKYKLLIRDSSFFDLYSATNDSITRTFTATQMREYGSLKLELEYQGGEQLIIQLLNEKEAVLREDIISSSKTINYPYLIDGKYKLKAIVDKNKNGKWDSGVLETKTLPERIQYVSKIIDIRANWDNEQIWEIVE